MSTHREFIHRLKETVLNIEPMSELIFYGSRARGDEKEESDWDISILLPYSSDLQNEQKFRHKLFDLELQFGQAISALVKSKEEWEGEFRITPLYQSILREGIAL